MTKEPDDFAKYSNDVRFPEETFPEDVIKWFDRVFSDWMSIPGIYTSSGLLKAIEELSHRGWQFTLTLLPGEVPEGVSTNQREIYEEVIVYDIRAAGIGYANRKSPYFVGVSQDHLTLSKHNDGLVKAFTPKEIFGLQTFLSPQEAGSL